MKEIFTQAALASRSLPELRVIFRKVRHHVQSVSTKIGLRAPISENNERV